MALFANGPEHVVEKVKKAGTDSEVDWSFCSAGLLDLPDQFWGDAKLALQQSKATGMQASIHVVL